MTSDPECPTCGGGECGCGYLQDLAAQKQDWEAFRQQCHAKGACEFSGLLVTECQRSICDCFETPEGAEAIVAAATKPLTKNRLI